MPEIDRLWDRDQQSRQLLVAAIICADAQGKSGLVEALNEIEPPIVEDWATREEQTHHDIAAWVELVREALSLDEANIFHAGLTSSDLADTALAVRMQVVDTYLCPAWRNAVAAMARFAMRWRDEPIIGRTHGQPAEYISVGRRTALDALALSRAGLDTYDYAKASGPVGAHADAKPRQFLSIPSTQVVPRDRLAEWCHGPIMISLAMEQAAINLRLAMRWPNGYLTEKGGTHGSSSMAWKKNPARTERLCGLAQMVRADARVVQDSSILWEERDISHSSVEREALRRVCSLTTFALRDLTAIYEELDVDVEAIQALNEQWLHSGEATYDLLVDKAGLTRLEAYARIRRMGISAAAAGLVSSGAAPGAYHSSQEPELWKAIEVLAESSDG